MGRDVTCQGHNSDTESVENSSSDVTEMESGSGVDMVLQS